MFNDTENDTFWKQGKTYESFQRRKNASANAQMEIL